MSVVLANNANTTLAAAISSVATTMSVVDASSFPTLGVGEYFYGTIEDSNGNIEIVKVTAISGDTFTIVRGQEGTIAIPFQIGALVELRITVQNLEDHFDATAGSVIDSAIASKIGVSIQAYDADLTTWGGLTPSANAQSLITAADYAAMRSLLGLVIGTNVQAYDADLTTWAGLTPSANAQSLVTAADYAAMRSLLGLVIGTNVQAYDANTAKLNVVQSWAAAQTFLNTGLKVLDTDASNAIILKPGSNITAERTLTITTGDADRTLDISSGNVTVSTFGASLIDDASASAARTTLGLGTMATEASSSYAALSGATFSGTITISNTDPILQYYDSNSGSDEKRTFASGSGTNYIIQFVNDTAGAGTTAFGIVRSGYSPSYAYFACLLRPGTDNVYTLGNASFRWSEVFAGTGTINTSDAREKTPLEPITPQLRNAVVRIMRGVGTYKWLSSVAMKGIDAARTHVGVTAQDVQKAFAEEGLDAGEFGLFCEDVVYTTERVYAPDGFRVVSERQVPTGEIRYGVRYDQLIMLALAVLFDKVFE